VRWKLSRTVLRGAVGGNAARLLDKKDGKTKTPFCFTMADDSIFAFAGLWETWKNPAGQLIETCSIITTTPNSLLQDVHDRMPVILPDEAYDQWLGVCRA
jgi:putative SOS response-associated peptidase YedK